jgi:hypothetical protein
MLGRICARRNGRDIAGVVETYQRVFALHHFTSERLAVLVYQLEGSADLWPPNSLGSIGYSFSLHTLLFIFKGTASGDKQDARFP